MSAEITSSAQVSVWVEPPRSYGRATPKLRQGCRLAKALDLKHRDRDQLYTTLEKSGFNWDGKVQEWSKFNAWRGSAFEDANQLPTDTVKIRIMAHPDKLPALLSRLQQTHGLQLTEVSNPYPNREGVGVRVYITGALR